MMTFNSQLYVLQFHGLAVQVQLVGGKIRNDGNMIVVSTAYEYSQLAISYGPGSLWRVAPVPLCV